MSSTKALILPADTPPRASSIKRQLLFFDSVLLFDPDADTAVLNPGDISETFPNGRQIRWGAHGHYSRSPEYVEAHRVLFAATHKLQTQGKIRILKPLPPSALDPKYDWIASAAASQDVGLLRAALPDYRKGSEAYHRKHDGWYHSVVLSDENYESAHKWMLNVQHHEMPEIETEWNQLGWVRLGRLLKSLRRAGVELAFPLALDGLNQNICLALGAKAYHQAPSASDLAMQAIALDVVDPVRLDQELDDLSWEGVVRLRKEVLPHVSRLRRLLVDYVAVARKPQNADLEVYARALADLKDKYRRASDEVRETWRRLKFKTLDAGVVTASGGLSTVAPPGGWATVMMTIAGVFIVKMASGTPADLHKIVTAWKAQKASPLFFFDVLPERVEKIAREAADGQ